MVENKEIEIIECKYSEREDIIKFLIQITSEEFGFTEWNNYFEHKLVEKYKKGNNKFWIALNKENKVIGTCGGLQQDENTIKMNCFYINSKYRNLGIGQRLYDLLLEFAEKENYKEIILCTFKEFDIAIKFYEKRGFKLYETIEDEFWYKKEL
mgnify:CR=1 FL=1